MASAFIDTNIFVAFGNARDRDHGRSTELLERVRKGEFGTPYTSDYVFDEAVTTAVVRTRRLAPAVKVGKIILGSKSEGLPALARLLRVDEHIFDKAWTSFQAGRLAGLSFTDHTILAQLEEFKIDVLLSFDTGFDGLAARVP